VAIYGGSAVGDAVDGNYIGVDVTGTEALGNTYSGVYVGSGSGFSDNPPGSASDATIGGTSVGAGNVISTNGNFGVWISGAGATGVLVEGNKIGTDASGWTDALGNSLDGIRIDSGASNNTIGGTVAGAGNIIAFNAGNGVTVGDDASDASTGNAILGNAIYANSQLGIDLGNDGVTLNDSSGHTGPNLFQDFPVLSSAILANGSTTITGTLSASPDTTYRVEFFSNVVADQTGYGQGQTFLTFASVTTDGTGAASFSVQTPNPVATGLFISATATDPNGNTSEFSADIVNSVTWTGGGGDNQWSDPANWSDDQVPGAGDDVVINVSGATPTISTGNQSVHSVTINDPLSITGGSLTVAASSTISGGLAMTGGALTATGTGTSLMVSGTTTASGGSLYAAAGATLSLADLTSYTLTANFATTTFEASGANSVLSLPDLSSIAVQATYPEQVNVEASSGGDVSMPMLSQVSASLVVQSTGSGSVIDLSALTDFSAQLDVYSSPGALTVTDQGTVVDPALTSLNNVSVTLDGTGTLSIEAWTTLTNASLTITAGSYSFPSLTDIDSSNLNVQANASLTLPAVANYTSRNNFATTTFEASGANSVLSLPDLTSIAVQATYPEQVNVQASSGGDVSMPMLAQVAASLVVQSTGSGSVVDLSGLADFSAQLDVYGTPGALTVSDQGTVLDPELRSREKIT
jgi:hypothetical protein